MRAAPAASPSPAAAARGRAPVPRPLLRVRGASTAARTSPGAEAPGFDDRGLAGRSPCPHTWGAEPFKSAWYRLRLPLARRDPARRVYVVFEGVAVFADVYLNGHHLGQHRGAFTRFVFDATQHVVDGENVLAVRANNELLSTADSLPSGTGKQLYYLYGGIYRKAWLLETDAVHVDPLDHASSGVYVTPTNVTADGADLAVRTLVRNALGRRPRGDGARRVRDAARARRWRRWRARSDLEPGARGEVSASTHV